MDRKHNWHNVEIKSDFPKKVKIERISVWMITEDHKVVVVSEDGQTWKFPGGKPELKEEYEDTIYRGIKEETGLDISVFEERLQPFGYYNLEKDTDKNISFVGFRYFLPLQDTKGWKLFLEPENTEVVKFCCGIELNEVPDLMPELKEGGEYKAVKRLLNSI